MGELAGDRDSFEVRLANVFDEVKHHLDERARRLLLGAMAREIGHGGISVVAEVTATAADTVGRGAAELAAGIEPDGRIRRKGAGRKPVTETDPGILAALDELVDAGSRGDPMRALRWTTKLTAKLAGELTRGGHPCSARTVAPLLRRLGFSLHGNSKTIEGKQHPDRDAQFRYINDLVSSFQAGGSRSSRSIPRRRSWSATMPTRAPSGRVSLSGSTTTTSPISSWARSPRTGCMT